MTLSTTEVAVCVSAQKRPMRSSRGAMSRTAMSSTQLSSPVTLMASLTSGVRSMGATMRA